MASFTEEAILKVTDQSSAQLKTINAALRALMKSAKSLKDASANITVKTKGLAQATTQVANLEKAVKSFRSMPPILVSANAANLAQTRQQIQALRAAARAPINVGGGGGVGGPVTPRTGRRGALGAIAQGASSGFGLGIPMGVGGPPGLVALEVAAYAAAAALKAVAESAERRDRTNLQSAVQLTKAQRQRFAEMDDVRRKAEQADPSSRPPLPMTQDVRSRLRTSLISDVGGTTEQERADNAEILTKYLERDVYARQFAADPTRTPEEAAASLRKLVQATNNATGSMVKNNEITADARRVFAGIQAAQIADPDLKPELVKSTLANLKSAGFSLSPEALTTTLLTASNQGQRAGNEVFRAIKALSGQVDVKMLNNALSKLGKTADGQTELLQDVKTNKQGNVIVNSGTPIDQLMLQTNPAKWLNTYFKPILDRNVAAETERLRKRRKGETDKQYEERTAALDTEEGQQAVKVAQISKAFPGANSAVINGINQMILNYQQFGVALEQSAAVIREGNVPEAIKKSWSAQWEIVKAKLEDRRAEMGDAAFQAVGLADKLAQVVNAIGDPTGKDAVALSKTIGGTLATLANPLNLPAMLLKAAGESLIQAAGEQSMLGQAMKFMAEKAGFKAKTPEEIAKERRDQATAAAVKQQETERKHNDDALKREERRMEAARKAEAAAKTPEQRTAAINAQLQIHAEMERLRTALGQNTATITSIVERAKAAEVAPTEIPKQANWVQQAIDNMNKPPKAPIPVKPVGTAWGADTPETRAANRKAEAEARRQVVRQQTVPKAERADPKWGDPAKPTPMKEVTDAANVMNSSATTMGTSLEGGALAVANSGQTAAGYLETAAGGIGGTIGDVAAAKIAAAANQIRDIVVTVNNSAAGAKPNTGALAPAN